VENDLTPTGATVSAEVNNIRPVAVDKMLKFVDAHAELRAKIQCLAKPTTLNRGFHVADLARKTQASCFHRIGSQK